MSDSIIIKVPTISDFAEVDVIEVLISPGDTVAIESPLITLESDKASMDVPSPVSGQIVDVLVRIGDRVSEGSPIARVETLNPTAQTDESHGTSAPIDPVPESEMSPGGTESRPDSTAFPEAADFEVDLVVIGSGPGGYTAAFPLHLFAEGLTLRGFSFGLRPSRRHHYPVTPRTRRARRCRWLLFRNLGGV